MKKPSTGSSETATKKIRELKKICTKKLAESKSLYRIVQTILTLSSKSRYECMKTLQRLLKKYEVEWLEEVDMPKEAIDAGITKKMRDSSDAAVFPVTKSSLTQEACFRLQIDQKNYKVGEIMYTVIEKCMETSVERQDELQKVANKLKMLRNRTFVKLVNKYRVLCQELINSGCKEVLKDANEQVTVCVCAVHLKCAKERPRLGTALFGI